MADTSEALGNPPSYLRWGRGWPLAVKSLALARPGSKMLRLSPLIIWSVDTGALTSLRYFPLIHKGKMTVAQAPRTQLTTLAESSTAWHMASPQYKKLQLLVFLSWLLPVRKRRSPAPDSPWRNVPAILCRSCPWGFYLPVCLTSLKLKSYWVLQDPRPFLRPVFLWGQRGMARDGQTRNSVKTQCMEWGPQVFCKVGPAPGGTGAAEKSITPATLQVITGPWAQPATQELGLNPGSTTRLLSLLCASVSLSH